MRWSTLEWVLAFQNEIESATARTISVTHPHLTALEVAHLIDNLLNDGLQLAHLDLEEGERLLVGDSAGSVS